MKDPTADHGQHRGAFDVDGDRALDALERAWGGDHEEFWVGSGDWGAHRKGAPDDEVVTGATPDELTANLRADTVPPERAVSYLTELDEIKRQLEKRHPGRQIWHSPRTDRTVLWCARPNPLLNEASPGDLSAAIEQAEAAGLAGQGRAAP